MKKLQFKHHKLPQDEDGDDEKDVIKNRFEYDLSDLLSSNNWNYPIRLMLDGPAVIVVDDDLVDSAVECIEESAKTGRIGDGKIFVSSIEKAIRIRTGEKGSEAI